MKNYDITITETIEEVITIIAESIEDAERIIKKQWDDGIIELVSHQLTAVEFSAVESEEQNLGQKETINVLLIKPGEYPKRISVGTELADLQKEVEGNIEVVYPYHEEIGLICNEEGKLSGLSLNRDIISEDGERVDIIAGNFLIVGLTEDSFGSLTDEQMKQYEKKFHQPETFIRMGRDILTIPIPDEQVIPKTESQKLVQAQSR